MLDIEIGYKGYLLTGDSSSLEVFHTTLQRIPSDRNELLNAGTHDTTEIRLIHELVSMLDEKVIAGSKLIEKYQLEGPDKAKALLKTQNETALMKRFSKTAAQLEKTERLYLRSFAKDKAATDSFRESGFILTAIASILFLIICFYLIIKDLRAKQMIDARIKKMNETLEVRIKERTAELNSSRDEIRSILNRIHDGFLSINKDGIINFVNVPVLEIFSANQSDLLGKHLPQLNPSILGEKLTEFLLTILEKAINTQTSLMFPKNEKYFDCTIYSTNDGITVFIQDITELENTINKLQDATERFELLSNATGEAVYDLNLSKHIAWWNDMWYQLTGYTHEEISPAFENWINLIHEEDRPQVLGSLNKSCTNAESSWTAEYRIRKKDGKLVNILDRAHIIYDEEGNLKRMLGTMLDMTERKSAELKQQQDEKKYRLLFQENPLPMWTADYTTYKFSDVNESAIKHYGYTRSEFLKMTVFDLRPEEDRALLRERMKSHSFQYPKLGVWRHQKKDGTIIFVEIYAHKIEINGAEGRIVLAQDVTEKMEAQRSLQASRDELRQLSTHLELVREEERANIAREIHDELGQQLTGIKMDIAWIQKKCEDEDQTIKDKLSVMNNLVDETVQSIRRISYQLRPGMLDDLGLAAALEWQSNEFQARTGINCSFKANQEDATIDHQKSIGIFRIYQEALTNIARHAAATNVVAELQISENQLQMDIRDNGKGFNTEEISAKNTLGLIGMKERILIMNGQIKLESHPGTGTHIHINVPLHSINN